MPNTITTQLNDKQFNALAELLGYAVAQLETDRDNAFDDEAENEAIEMMEAAEELQKALGDTKTYLWTSSDGRIELEVAAGHVRAIAQPGDNLAAVQIAIDTDARLSYLLGKMDEDTLMEYYNESGAGDPSEPAKTRKELKEFLLWSACHDINDEMVMEE